MTRQLTLEYWEDDGWFVGRLKETPGVFSQGETLDDLEENVSDAYALMLAEHAIELPQRTNTKTIEVQM